ncbi:MAG TPA: hypothetical protein VF008_07030 [Niastella sp.]
MKNLFAAFLLIALLPGCEKHDDEKACWQAFSPGGGDIPGLILCDKTLAEAEEAHPGMWFYNANENKYCWQLQTPYGIAYIRQVPVSMADKMKTERGYTNTKMDCNSFCTWTYYDKFKSKITNHYGPTKAHVETYVGDTCSTLYVGRVIVIKETTDSIYTREYIKVEP